MNTASGDGMPHLHLRALSSIALMSLQWGSIESNAIVHKLMFLLTERRFVPHNEPLLGIPKRRIGHFVAWQCLVVLACVAISQTIAAIGFPILIISLIPLRWKLFPRWFTASELKAMDALTATSEVVLASLGGAPDMPEDRMGRGRRSSMTVDLEKDDGSQASPDSTGGSSQI